MSLPQQKLREIILQILFSLDHHDCEPEDIIPLIMEELCVTKKNVKEAYSIAQSIYDCRDKLDEEIVKVSINFEFDRIHRVERNILRLGIYELFHREDLPAKVVLSEAIRLSKKFSTPESTGFINALLDQIGHQNGKLVSTKSSIADYQIEKSDESLINYLLENSAQPVTKEGSEDDLDQSCCGHFQNSSETEFQG